MLMPEDIVRITFKGELAKKHEEDKNSKCPNINFIVIISFLKNLGRHIISSATKGINVLILLPGKTKITNLGHKLKARSRKSGLGLGPFGGQQNIFGLNIAMDQIPLMHVLKALNDL